MPKAPIKNNQIFHCETQCPNCGSENINYYSMDIQDEGGFYPVHCQDCGALFEEWFEIKYDYTYWDGEVEDPGYF